MIEIKNHQYFRQEKWAWHVLDSATPMSFDIFFLIVVISLCINQIDIVGVVYSWFSDCHAPLLQYSEFSSSNSLNIFKVFIYRVNNQRVMTTKLLKHHCYKNYSPLQLVGTKYHGFRTLVAPKSKHFGFQYKLMGEGYKKYKTGAKSLNILSTSWKCSKEFELASLEA